MEDDLHQHHHQESAHFTVKGMDSVIATVSGYHGSERFNLIRLIARTGASYVGNMNRSVTHLVCWKFEGRKYELAKKLKIAIVNHCWVEECIKRGRRVPEEPYTLKSGEEMGPLVLDILLGINLEKAQSKRNVKEPVVDVGSEDVENAVWTNSTDENIFPRTRQNSHHSRKSIVKTIKINSKKDCPSSSRYCLENLPGPTIIELEGASTSQPAHSCRLRKRNSTSPEPQFKNRRLVKKHTSIKDWLLPSTDLEDREKVKMVPQNKRNRVLFDSPDVERRKSTSSGHSSDIRRTFISQDDSNSDDDIEEIVHVNDKNQNSHANGVPSSLATSEELCEAAHLDSDNDIEEIVHVNDENQNSHPNGVSSSLATSEELCEVAHLDLTQVEKLPASSELSCVICWTDFSSTRGVLPCGHRFCFSCIQNWADHMSSRRKPSTCPLCKASFTCITKVDDAVSSDQKIYSQSIPNDTSKLDIYILPDENCSHRVSLMAPICCRCSSREPEDLLVKCQFCQVRCVHSYCLDPPLFPWTCAPCKDLQMLYLHHR